LRATKSWRHEEATKRKFSLVLKRNPENVLSSYITILTRWVHRKKNAAKKFQFSGTPITGLARLAGHAAIAAKGR